jgi:hypothetical protein
VHHITYEKGASHIEGGRCLHDNYINLLILHASQVLIVGTQKLRDAAPDVDCHESRWFRYNIIIIRRSSLQQWPEGVLRGPTPTVASRKLEAGNLTNVGPSWQFVSYYSLHFKIKVMFGHKLRYEIKKRCVSWNFSQTSPNQLECCHNQCKCCCWWTTRSNNSLHLFNNWYVDSMASTHINAVFCALVPSAQNGKLLVKLGPKVFDFTMDTPSSPKKLLVRAMQCTQFHAKILKYDLKPMDFLKRNFYFEADGVLYKGQFTHETESSWPV